jgi:hypothetical protein
MKHRNSHFAVGYWSRLRSGRAVPDQVDIDPKALKRLLPIVFLLEARADGSYVYRLAGTTLCERYGGELRGRNYLDPWDPASRLQLLKLLRQATAERLPLCINSVGATAQCGMVEIETVLMPIRSGTELPERFLAVAQVLTDVASLAGEPISFERMVSAKLVREEHRAASPGEPRPGPGRDWRAHPRAPHLRLVNFDRADPLRFDVGRMVRDVAKTCAAAIGRAGPA